MEKPTEINQEEINEIEVKAATIICGDVTRVCDPENWFDIIEQCKICARCV
ncbi:hypothetical protein [uncultured Flavobacterium sp.]|uniref:hypothetical protein n=1 Tax=uncultured Flavobacterium sp. TaxID=165435 RepID=UPI0025E590C0|nr:hypothetical protein [uncultured Flavobacterium sp.]